MKRNSILWISVVLVLGSIATYVLAQQVSSSGATGRLGDAVALINDGKPQPARDVIATIPQSDPGYAAAQCYDALCLYQMTNRFGFYNAMKSPVVKQAVIAPELRRDLDFKNIDVLFYFRKFDEALPCIESFQRANPGAAQMGAVAEYRLASLFELGMKRTQEACLNTDTNKFNQRWAVGRSNLESFLAAAATFPGTNYTVIPKHVLKEDVWVARLTLGDENATLAEVQTQDVASREKVALLRTRLYQRLQLEKTDQNIQMLGDFLKAFPDSKQRKRVEFDIAGLSFHRGKELAAEADAAERAGDAKTANEKRATARGCFATQRTLQGAVAVDKDLGIEASDVLDAREDLLFGYALEKDFTTLTQLTATILANSTPGDLNWMMAKVHDGIVLANRTPPKPAEANIIFDDLLKLGFNGRPDHDRILITAARWRVNLAVKASDLTDARRVIQVVHDGVCVANMKADFLKDHAIYAETKTVGSK